LRKISPLSIAALAAIVAIGVAGQAAALPATGESEQGAAPDAPVVVEMFLSQSCRLCPPAADYVAELARRPGVVALAWHIDYWNMLSNRNYGRWEDPFSRAAFTERQRRYNQTIRSRDTVFTPQAVINGEESAVGSKRDQVEALIGAERTAATTPACGSKR